MKNTSMKLGMTCLSQGTSHIPNIFSAPTISVSAKKSNAMINGVHADKYFLCPAVLNIVSAIIPAIMLRKTAVSADMPYIHSYTVSILFLPLCLFVWLVIFKKLSPDSLYFCRV